MADQVIQRGRELRSRMIALESMDLSHLSEEREAEVRGEARRDFAKYVADHPVYEKYFEANRNHRGDRN